MIKEENQELIIENNIKKIVPSKAKEDAFKEINSLQDEYVNNLIKLMNSEDYEMMKQINFTSPTGTGKTKMMSKLINKLPDYYFIVTTLSKGQLHLQIKASLKKDCLYDNFMVYGNADYKINTKIQAEDILSQIPKDSKCIWLRDEGHIKTNRFEELLANKCFKVINFSATNINTDIKCNFTQTMMLRSVNQSCGTPEDAIKKLLEVKEKHKNVKNYNPCAIFRCISGDAELYKIITDLCKKYKLKYIDITEETYNMAEICEDNNEYDVIINKFKIVEGIDIRRAHVLYMDNQPSNNATTIQVIGRCRRNALLYRDDIDIFARENEELLKNTRECFVFYNVKSMKIMTDENGELQQAFCNYISCQELKTNSKIKVKKGQLPNGLHIIELENKTGTFDIIKDENTGFNIISPSVEFYNEEIIEKNEYFFPINQGNYKIKKENVSLLMSENNMHRKYFLKMYSTAHNIKCEVNSEIIDLFQTMYKKYTKSYLCDELKNKDIFSSKYPDYDTEILKEYIENFNKASIGQRGYKKLSEIINNIENYEMRIDNNYNCADLKSLCTEDEIIFLKYICIKAKENKKSLDYITSKIDNYCHFLKCRNAFLSKKYGKNYRKISTEDILNNRQFNYFIMTNDIKINDYYSFNTFIPLIKGYQEVPTITKTDVLNFFNEFDKNIAYIKNSDEYPLDLENIYFKINERLENVYNELKTGIISIVKYDFSHLFEPLNEDELLLKRKKQLPLSEYVMKNKLIDTTSGYKSYEKIYNDKESAIIGTDMMHLLSNGEDAIWTEQKAITSKVTNYNKLNNFISSKYKKQIDESRKYLFTGTNDFKIDKRCNSMIGYCVEYYSKYLVYGEEYLNNYIQSARVYFKRGYPKKYPISDEVIIRACFLKYKDLMIRSFGTGVEKIIKGPTVENLMQEKNKEFCELVVKLGTQTAEFVKKSLYDEKDAINNIDPNLSIKHIAGLADYITEDTILDIKVTNNITEKYIRQVLGYHYLSTKRSDLNIKRVIVYDAVSQKSVTVNIK